MHKYSTTIAIDTERSVFHFYSVIDGATVTHNKKGFAGGAFDDDFFSRFKDAVREFAENNPSQHVRKVTVVLPDNAVLTDMVKVPTMSGIGQTKKTLDVTLAGLYRNYKELKLLSYTAAQNKQYSTFALAAVKKSIASAIYAACAESKILVDTLTYAAASTIGGAVAANPKLRGATYLFLDVKDVYSRFIFVVNGKPVGSYTLPFGYEFLKKPRVIGEDMLFDHSYAELTVLNARERARAKKLTVMADINDDFSLSYDEDEEAEAEVAETETAPEAETAGTAESVESAAEDVPAAPGSRQKIFTRKNPRKLPKFMQREVPETPEGILAENFRVYVKWALTLIHENGKLTELGAPTFVCVNLPEELLPVLESANSEADENGIGFVPLISNSVDSTSRLNLELYGGLNPKYISSSSKF